MHTSAAAAAPNPSLLFQRPWLNSPQIGLRLRARSDWRACSVPGPSLATEGPSCLFVGPIETASQETLEALYCQARDAYYSGNPLIVDDMFDKVELRLRLYGSKSVVKYPRCSLRRQSTYADAEEDPSQALTLASVWILLLAFATCAVLVPTVYALGLAFTDAMKPTPLINIGRHPSEILMMVNRILLVAVGYLVGYPIALASVQALRRLWMHDLVALKGSCPNCSEEVFAFVRTDKSYPLQHRAECHVCESSLEFRAKVEQSTMRPGRRWVYGRVYLVPPSYKRSQR